MLSSKNLSGIMKTNYELPKQKQIYKDFSLLLDSFTKKTLAKLHGYIDIIITDIYKTKA